MWSERGQGTSTLPGVPVCMSKEDRSPGKSNQRSGGFFGNCKSQDRLHKKSSASRYRKKSRSVDKRLKSILSYDGRPKRALRPPSSTPKGTYSLPCSAPVTPTPYADD